MTGKERNRFGGSSNAPLRAVISGLNGWQIVLIASICIAIAFAFSSLSSAFSSLLNLASQTGNLSYEVPILADISGKGEVSLFCIPSTKEGLYLPDYFKTLIHNSSTVEVGWVNKVSEAEVLGFTGSNASYGYFLSPSCNSTLVEKNSEELIAVSILGEINMFSNYWIAASISITFLSVFSMVIRHIEQLRRSLEYVFHSGATSRILFIEVIKASVILSFLSNLFGMAVGLLSLRATSFIIEMIVGFSPLPPSLIPEQAIDVFVLSSLVITLAIVAPSYTLAIRKSEAAERIV
ncbi:MAG: hypothetical protein ACP5GN_01205 [Fervidicoccaceae archaeon]